MSDDTGEWLCLAFAYVTPAIFLALVLASTWWTIRGNRRSTLALRGWAESHGFVTSGSFWTHLVIHGDVDGSSVRLRFSSEGPLGPGRTTLVVDLEGAVVPAFGLMVRRGLLFSVGGQGWRRPATGLSEFDALFTYQGSDPAGWLPASALQSLVRLHGLLNPLVRDKMEVWGRPRRGLLEVIMVGTESGPETLDTALEFAVRVFGTEPHGYR